MPAKKARRGLKGPRPVQAQPVEEQEQPHHKGPRRSQLPDVEERGSAPEPITESELEPRVEEAEENASARKRVAPRVVTNLSEEEKELVIGFLQQNPTLYSKRLAGYKDTAAKDRLWAEHARQMNRTPNELKTWYESMRTKLGKLKKDVTKSGQAADRFTATEQWIWQRFQFLLEHITHMPRRTVASFTARLQPAANDDPPSANTREVPVDTPHIPPAHGKPDDISHAGTPAFTDTTSTAGVNPDVLVGLLETFLTERQSQGNPATAFGSFVDGSLRSLPPAIRRRAESGIIKVLHECQNDAERQDFRSKDLQQSAQADRYRPRAWYGEPVAQLPARRQMNPPVRQWQPPPSQWPANVTNPPDVWHSMDRPWVQEQFPEMNISCSPPITGNHPQSEPSTSAQAQSTSTADVQDISYCQLLVSDSPSLSGQVSTNLRRPNHQAPERRTSSTMISATENPQSDDDSTSCH